MPSSARALVKLTRPASRSHIFFTLATFVLVVAVMKIAETVLIPIALTVLLTFLLTPFVVKLTRWGLPRVAAIILTVVTALGVISAVGVVVVTQGISVAKRLPDYEENIREKLAAIRAPSDPQGLSRMTEMIRNLEKDLEEQPPAAAPAPAQAAQEAPTKPGGPAAPPPVPVEVRERKPGLLALATTFLGPLLEPLGTAAIVIVFVVAMLFQREELRDRFIRVISAGRLNLATQALDDAARRVNRYLTMQLVVNATYGIPVGIGLHLIGIPNSLLWGVLATLLRFIPFLGPWVAAAFPVALAAAVDPGWTTLMYTLCLFIVMEVVSNNLVEPWLYGASTGISNLALMVAAVFWTWVWGTPGLFLSTPLTVCIMVIGKHVAGLQFLSVLLGSEPGLDPAARFYQRMLSMDSGEMTELAHRIAGEKGLETFYNDVFVPALYMSEQDRHSGALAEVRQKFIFESSEELIEDLERKDEPTDKDGLEPGDRWLNDRLPRPRVFALPARDDADELVGRMLQHLLRARGIEAEVVSATTSLDDAIHWINQHGIRIVVVSALPPAALFGARQLCRRLKEACPHARLIVGVWSQDGRSTDVRLRLRHPAPDAVVQTLGEATCQVERLLSPEHADTPPREHAAESVPVPDAQPIEFDDADGEEVISAVTQDLARHFDVPLSLVGILTTDAEFWRARAATAADLSIVQEFVQGSQPVNGDAVILVEDIHKDRRFSDTRLLTERGIRFYACVPLRRKGNRLVGYLTVVDAKPRHIDESDTAYLELRAGELMKAIESRELPPRPASAQSTED